MVYCHNCGTKNEDDAEFCSKCGTVLKENVERGHREKHRKRQRDECFGLPHGNIIGPLIIGSILILAGLSAIYGFEFWQYLWPALIVLIGILIIAGAIYGARRK
ncbi:MAG: zinc ribbon domain-containing protein [Methanobacteriaceae archaeon]|nr:zinc ribbon domain-containing protein [Methanobacteriaceae archaeon]